MPYNVIVKGPSEKTQRFLCAQYRINGICGPFAMDFLSHWIHNLPTTEKYYEGPGSMPRLVNMAKAQQEVYRNRGVDVCDSYFDIRVSNASFLEGRRAAPSSPASPSSSNGSFPSIDGGAASAGSASSASAGGRSRSSSAPPPAHQRFEQPDALAIAAFIEATANTKHWYVSCDFGDDGHAFAIDVSDLNRLRIADSGAGVMDFAEGSNIPDVIQEHLTNLENSIGQTCSSWRIKAATIAGSATPGQADSDDD